VNDTVLWLTALAGISLLLVVMWRPRARQRSRMRLLEGDSDRSPAPSVDDTTPVSLGWWLDRWLYVAGFRRKGSTTVFLLCASLSAVAGGFVAYAVQHSGILEQGVQWLSEVPGALGELFLPAIILAPWIIFAILSSLPWLYVRASRRQLVNEIEQDLPITAELLATLGEAGLGFDSAVERILASRHEDRALANELRAFRRDLLAGVPRIQALRRLATRVDLPNLSTVVSALVQAEQVGAGLANVLRSQADDLRNRRRERALRVAQALPVKLTVPLVLCFFPAIVIAVLGPTFFEIFQMLETYLAR